MVSIHRHLGYASAAPLCPPLSSCIWLESAASLRSETVGISSIGQTVEELWSFKVGGVFGRIDDPALAGCRPEWRRKLNVVVVVVLQPVSTMPL